MRKSYCLCSSGRAVSFSSRQNRRSLVRLFWLGLAFDFSSCLPATGFDTRQLFLAGGDAGLGAHNVTHRDDAEQVLLIFPADDREQRKFLFAQLEHNRIQRMIGIGSYDIFDGNLAQHGRFIAFGLMMPQVSARNKSYHLPRAVYHRKAVMSIRRQVFHRFTDRQIQPAMSLPRGSLR